MVGRFAGLGLAALWCGLACGQTGAAKLAFEVVSIKAGPPGSMMTLARSGRLHWKVDDAQADLGGVSLIELITSAYNVPDDQVSGPSWLAEARFDILAKLPEGATKSQVPEMLQAMLAERFKLAVHHDQKVMPVYALVVGKPPLKLKESAQDDSVPIPCNGGPGRGHTCHKVSMEELANQLTGIARMTNTAAPGMMSWGIDRPVIDMTGLKGVYDFTMDYGRLGGRGGRAGDVEPAGGPAELSILDAVKALGLRLEPRQHAFDIVVIDHVERVPAEN